jgi:hypothetical protein
MKYLLTLQTFRGKSGETKKRHTNYYQCKTLKESHIKMAELIDKLWYSGMYYAPLSLVPYENQTQNDRKAKFTLTIKKNKILTLTFLKGNNI